MVESHDCSVDETCRREKRKIEVGEQDDIMRERMCSEGLQVESVVTGN